MAGKGTALVDAWYSSAPWLWLLRPVEMAYRLLVALRRALYRSGILSSYRASVPVVVVGNITVGGTGKTPVVIALVEALQERGLRCGVVSRGYGASAGSYPHVLNSSSAANQSGDEPLLIHRRTGAPCVVDPDRTRAVQTLLEQFEVDLVLSDDGLQHYALCRDLEIAVLDAHRGIGNGFCLPAGPLREPASRLALVDSVLYRGGEDASNAVRYVSDCLVNLSSSEQLPLQPSDQLPREVYAVAGIGQPQQFFRTLETAGFACERREFSDHHLFTAADLADMVDKPILMTEKDAVKCVGITGDNAWFLRIRAQLPASVVDAVASLAVR